VPLRNYSLTHYVLVCQAIKAANEKVQKEFGFCVIDGHKQKIGNFKIEPPGLFRGRGDHPKQGMLKRRVVPEDVIINCSKYVLLSVCLSLCVYVYLSLLYLISLFANSLA